MFKGLRLLLLFVIAAIGFTSGILFVTLFKNNAGTNEITLGATILSDEKPEYQIKHNQPKLDPLSTIESLKKEPTPTSIVEEPSQPIIEKKPDLPFLVYDDIDLKEGEVNLTFKITCDDSTISLLPFSVLPWYDGIFETNEFEANSNTVVAWEHLGYYGFWMHSGLDFFNNPQTGYPLQFYFEENSDGKRPYQDEFLESLKVCLINSQVLMEVGGKQSENLVKAAVRVPSSEVPELSEHIMDLVPYLAKRYPESGFVELKSPAIILYLCGQRISGEAYNFNELFWAQARIIVAFEPIN